MSTVTHRRCSFCETMVSQKIWKVIPIAVLMDDPKPGDKVPAQGWISCEKCYDSFYGESA